MSHLHTYIEEIMGKNSVKKNSYILIVYMGCEISVFGKRLSYVKYEDGRLTGLVTSYVETAF